MVYVEIPQIFLTQVHLRSLWRWPIKMRKAFTAVLEKRSVSPYTVFRPAMRPHLHSITPSAWRGRIYRAALDGRLARRPPAYLEHTNTGAIQSADRLNRAEEEPAGYTLLPRLRWACGLCIGIAMGEAAKGTLRSEVNTALEKVEERRAKSVQHVEAKEVDSSVAK